MISVPLIDLDSVQVPPITVLKSTILVEKCLYVIFDSAKGLRNFKEVEIKGSLVVFDSTKSEGVKSYTKVEEHIPLNSFHPRAGVALSMWRHKVIIL